MQHNHHLAEIVRLREQLDDAHARIKDLSADAETAELIGVAGLTPLEARFAGAMAKYGRVSRDRMYSILYSDDTDGHGEKSLDVWLFKVRKKLAPFGVSINTLWGWGFELSAESRERVRSLMASAVAA